jgi:hypothetical protein
MLSACLVIGKIWVRSAAGGVPVAVKHGAVNESSSLKITRHLTNIIFSDVMLYIVYVGEILFHAPISHCITSAAGVVLTISCFAP